MKRQDYIDHGLEKVEYDYKRSMIVSYGAPMTDEERMKRGENGGIPANVAKLLGLEKKPLPEGTRHKTVRENRDYDHAEEIAAVARKIQPDIAPTVTLEDMPHGQTADVRRKLFTEFSETGLDLPKVSRRALEHELTDEQTYWTVAIDECFPIVKKQAGRLAARGKDESSHEISEINAFCDFLEGRQKDPDNPMGDPDYVERLLGVMAAGENDYSKDEKEKLLAHYVGNSRIGNRYARQFAKAAEALPEEAQPIADYIQKGWGEEVVMWMVQDRASRDTEEFIRIGKEQQTGTLQNIREGLEKSGTTTKEDMVKVAACSRHVKEAGKDDPSNQKILERMGTANRSIMKMYPREITGQISILITEMARTKVYERELLMSSSVKKTESDSR